MLHRIGGLAFDLMELNKKSNESKTLIDTNLLNKTWFEGAKDHLKQLTIPENFKGTSIELNINKLKQKVSEMSYLKDIPCTIESIEEAIGIVADIMFDIDLLVLKIDPIKAEYK